MFWKRVCNLIVNDFFSWETPLFLLPRTRMDILILGQGLWWFEALGQKACRTAGHDVCQGVGLASSSGKRGCPTLFPWYTRNNDDLEILCKTVHACTHVDTQASSFYGYVTLGLRIHFPYLSQPSVSKTCSFINSCIHPSPFWAFGKIFTAFTLQVHTHFFSSKTGVMISKSFSKKSWKLFIFKSVLAFKPKDIFFVLVCFWFFFHEVFCYLNMSIFLWGMTTIRACACFI